jgi:hypothetical protein
MAETRHSIRPHSDAVFDWMWRSNHGHKPSDGWRFYYACETWPNGCDDVIGSLPVTASPDAFPTECPDCGGPVRRLGPRDVGDDFGHWYQLAQAVADVEGE